MGEIYVCPFQLGTIVSFSFGMNIIWCRKVGVILPLQSSLLIKRVKLGLSGIKKDNNKRFHQVSNKHNKYPIRIPLPDWIPCIMLLPCLSGNGGNLQNNSSSVCGTGIPTGRKWEKCKKHTQCYIQGIYTMQIST